MQEVPDDFFGVEDSPPDQEEIYTVSRLNREARSLLEGSFSRIWLEGEISNLSRSASDHLYFTLKDENSEIDAVMFAGDNRYLDFSPEDGVAVLIRGTLTVYERRGRYQLKVGEMREAGKGRLQLKFERLKKKLKEEGLFKEEMKVPIPEFPDKLGVVTSSTGAAIQDIVSVIKERYPPATIYLFPVKVQGESASGEIAKAIDDANRFRSEVSLDLLIVGRGGGSLEDLWPFNEEEVARAISRSELPVISAVGHEVDFSISDFTADLRVPTPTAAGKEAVPDKQTVLREVKSQTERLLREEYRFLTRLKERLADKRNSFAFKLPFRVIEERSQQLDRGIEDLTEAARGLFAKRIRKHKELLQRLSSANPTRLLERGYSVTSLNGRPLIDARQVEKGQTIKTRLHRGTLYSSVQEVDSDGRGGEG